MANRYIKLTVKAHRWSEKKNRPLGPPWTERTLVAAMVTSVSSFTFVYGFPIRAHPALSYKQNLNSLMTSHHCRCVRLSHTTLGGAVFFKWRPLPSAHLRLSATAYQLHFGCQRLQYYHYHLLLPRSGRMTGVLSVSCSESTINSAVRGRSVPGGCHSTP